MQARLDTRWVPSRIVAIVFALVAIIALGVGSAYAIHGLSAPAAQSVQGVGAQAEHGPNSDLTRALPVAAPAHEPDSDLTRALPTAKATAGSAAAGDCIYVGRHKAC